MQFTNDCESPLDVSSPLDDRRAAERRRRLLDGVRMSVVTFLIFGIAGGMITGICTVYWAYEPTQRSIGTIDASWERSNDLSTVCVSQVLIGSTQTVVNITTPGPCIQDAIRSRIDLCQPRNHPELARHQCALCLEECLSTIITTGYIIIVSGGILGICGILLACTCKPAFES